MPQKHTVCFWGIGLAGGNWLSFHGLGSLLPPQGVAGFWQAAVLSTVAASVLFGFYLHYASQGATRD